MWIIHRIRPLVQNPIASIVLLAALFADLWFLPYDSGVKETGRSIVQGPRSTSYSFPLQAFVWRTDSGYSVTCMDCANMLPTPESNTYVYWYQRASYGGFWARTSRTDRTQLGCVATSNDWPEDEVLAAVRHHITSVHPDRNIVPSGIDRTLEGRRSSLLEGKDIHGAMWNISETTALWPGGLHDLASLSAFIALCWSFGWVPRYLRPFTRAGRLSLGLCPRCRYDITGLDRCPECGELIEPVEPPAQTQP